MKTRIKNSIKKNKTIVENFSYLSILQFLTIGTPIIVLPYLLRILGTDNYGAVIYSQTVVSFLTILINYGFDISGSKDIALIKNDKEQLSKVTSTILSSKCLIGIFVFLIYFIVIQFFHFDHDEKLLYYFSATIAISEIITPRWYFQGIEKMKFITLIVGLSKLLYLLLIFLFIKDADYYFIVPLLLGVPSAISGIVGLYIVFGRDKIKFHFASLREIYQTLIDGFSYFIAKTGSKLRDSSNIILIGLFFSNTYVAYYDLAYKIVSLYTVVFQNIPTAILPRLAITKDAIFARKVFYLSCLVSLLFIILIVLGSNMIVLIFGGHELIGATPYLRFLVFFSLLYAINTLTSYYLIVNDLQNEVYKAIFVSLLAYVLLMALLFFIKSVYFIILVFLLATFIDFVYKLIIMKKHNLINWIYVPNKKNKRNN